MKRWGLPALGLAGWIVACSSFDSAESANAHASADAGTDGPGDLTGIPHAFAIALSADAAIVTGKTATIPITITRGGAAKGPSTISVRGLADGLTAADVIVQESESTASLVVTADAAAKQGVRSLTVVGRNAAANDQVEVALNLLVRGPAGTLDLTWGVNGVAALPDSFDVLSMAATDDGALTISGADSTPTLPRRPLLTRLLSTGASDTAFNGGNKLFVPGSASGDGALRVAAGGAGAVMFAAFNSGGARIFRFSSNGSADMSVQGATTPGVQELDTSYSPETAALDPDGNWYTLAAAVLRRYAPDGSADRVFGAQTLSGGGTPGSIRSGGSGVTIGWSTIGAGVWRSAGTSLVRASLTTTTSTVDASGRFYLLESGKITRYQSGFNDVDIGFARPTVSTSFAHEVAPAMAAIGDDLYVYGGTAANIGGPVVSTTLLIKYLTSGVVDQSFGASGAAALSGTFPPAGLARTKDGRIYVAHAATNGPSRGIARYWP